MTDTRFLSLEQIDDLHRESLERYGGAGGVRDVGLLDAATAMPAAQFGGQYLHETIYDQAAAYLFHLCQNRPYRDGNKRTALAAALLFLDANGYPCTASVEELEQLTLAVARSELNKPTIAAFWCEHTRRRA